MEEDSEKDKENSEDIIEKRKEKFKDKFVSWIKDPYDRAFILVLAAAFIVRFVLFIGTSGQPLWYDAGSYFAASKRIAFNLPINDPWYYRRSPLWMWLGVVIFKMGLGEFGLRLASLLCSIGIVILSYLIIKDMFNKKLALLTSIGVSASWAMLFFSMRPLTYIPGTFFVLLALWFFLKGYAFNQGTKYLYLFAVSFGIAILVRMQNLMFVPMFFIFIFTKEKFRFLKNKKLWTVFLIFLLVLSPQIISYSKNIGNPIGDISGRIVEKGSFKISEYFVDIPYLVTGKAPQNFFQAISQPLIILIILGSIFFFADLFLGFDKIFKNQKLQLKLLIFLWIILLYLELGYVVDEIFQGYTLPSITFLFFLASYGLLEIGKFFSKSIKLKPKSLFVLIAIIFLILLIPNLSWGYKLTEVKKTSYLQVKEAGLWFKENTDPADIIISQSAYQIMYYSERSAYDYGFPAEMQYILDDFDKEGLTPHEIFMKGRLLFQDNDEEIFHKYVEHFKPRYLMLSIFEPHVEWAYNYPVKHNDTWKPVKAWFADNEQTRPTLVIYEADYSRDFSLNNSYES